MGDGVPIGEEGLEPGHCPLSDIPKQTIPHGFEQGCPIELSVVTHTFHDLHWPFNTVTEPRVTSETEERGFSFYLNVSCHMTHGYWIGQHGSGEYTFPF